MIKKKNSPEIDLHQMIRGADRRNVTLRVDTFPKEPEKMEAVLRRVEFADKPGIVYVSTHHHAEQIAADLRARDRCEAAQALQARGA